MKCIRCGAVLPDDSTFCSFCGEAQLTTTQPPYQQTPNSQGMYSQAPNNLNQSVYAEPEQSEHVPSGFE